MKLLVLFVIVETMAFFSFSCVHSAHLRYQSKEERAALRLETCLLYIRVISYLRDCLYNFQTYDNQKRLSDPESKFIMEEIEEITNVLPPSFEIFRSGSPEEIESLSSNLQEISFRLQQIHFTLEKAAKRPPPVLIQTS